MRRIETSRAGLTAALTAAALALTAALGAGLGAQQTQQTQPPRRSRPAASPQPAAAGRVAGIAPPPAPTYVVVPGSAPIIAPPGSVVVGSVPVVVLADGRVFADFGRGYEQVIQACGYAPAYSSGYASYGNYGMQTIQSAPPATLQPTVVQPTVVQPTIGVPQPVPYDPPIPNAAPLPSTVQQQTAYSSGSVIVNARACWSRDGRGQVMVARPW